LPNKADVIGMRKNLEQLKREGWIRQFVADDPLAKDAVEIYDLLGYEVHLQPPKRIHSKKCNSSSSKESQEQCQIVYIRPKKSPYDEEE
jgi:hypothetical protein